MQDFVTMDLDSMMKDIVDIFHLEGVKLIRLSGLFNREKQLSNYQKLTPDELDKIIHKLKQAKIIDYQFITYCPHCYEVSYQIEKVENPFSARKCDTCGQFYIPQTEISLYELKPELIK